jgi:hypothetical protein
MDPHPLTTAEWNQTWDAVRWLWFAFLCALVAGPSLLTAHALIPSAVSTHTISDRWMSTRVLFYAVGLIALAGIGLCFFMAASNTEWIQSSYNKFWH